MRNGETALVGIQKTTVDISFILHFPILWNQGHLLGVQVSNLFLHIHGIAQVSILTSSQACLWYNTCNTIHVLLGRSVYIYCPISGMTMSLATNLPDSRSSSPSQSPRQSPRSSRPVCGLGSSGLARGGGEGSLSSSSSSLDFQYVRHVDGGAHWYRSSAILLRYHK